MLDDGPAIPHSDGAGVIEATGEGVSADRIGERVWVDEAQYGRRAAALAAVSAIFDAPEMSKSWRLSSIYTKHGSQNDNVNI